MIIFVLIVHFLFGSGEELRVMRENEERLKVQLAEIQRKEQYYIMRLASKENELQELGVYFHVFLVDKV